ncbi:MAG: phosphoribosylanthranilate isomerase [SAR324 cluster bacterium]|nr:phosphoribosylanthranilate isomerase [SAR324 cluster bacterium]
MPDTVVKICGLVTMDEVKACLAYGADWLGFNCYPKSKRFIPPEKIRELVSIVPKNVLTVGVFVNESAGEVNRIMRHTGMNLVQLHGDETPEYTQMLIHKYFRAFRVSEQFQLDEISKYRGIYFLLDSYHAGHYGGTGASFNWEIAKRAKSFGQLILAGGLTPDNVGEAIKTVRPFGVDVCSGVELVPGVKDFKRIQAFISAVKSADGKNKIDD